MKSLFVQLGDGKAQDALPLTEHECFYGDSLKLLQTACHEIGPAAQTLGALLIHAKGSRGHCTFASADTIAKTACLTRRTVIRHLATLADSCWIENLGRQHLPGSRMKRRTCTIKLRPRATVEQRFFPLPKWLAASCLNWSEKLMLGFLASQECQKRYSEEEVGGCADGREAMKRTEICQHTGLTRNTYWNARGSLLELRAVIYGDGFESEYDVTRLRLNPETGVRMSAIPAPPECKIEASLTQARFNHETSVKPVTGGSPNLSQELPNLVTPTSPKLSHRVPKPVTGGAQNCHLLLVEPSIGNLLDEPSGGTSCENLLSEQASCGVPHSPGPDIFRSLIRIDPEADARQVSELCRKLGISSGEVLYLWTVAAWLRLGHVSQEVVASARSGTETNSTSNAIGYFRTHVSSAIGLELHYRLRKATKRPKSFAGNVPTFKPCVDESVVKSAFTASSDSSEPRPKQTREQQLEGYRKLAKQGSKSA